MIDKQFSLSSCIMKNSFLSFTRTRFTQIANSYEQVFSKCKSVLCLYIMTDSIILSGSNITI